MRMVMKAPPQALELQMRAPSGGEEEEERLEPSCLQRERERERGRDWRKRETGFFLVLNAQEIFLSIFFLSFSLCCREMGMGMLYAWTVGAG